MEHFEIFHIVALGICQSTIYISETGSVEAVTVVVKRESLNFNRLANSTDQAYPGRKSSSILKGYKSTLLTNRF